MTDQNQAGTFLVAAADIERARDQTAQFYAERHPNRSEKQHRWFPDRVSPTGAEPPTHYLCWYPRIEQALWDEMVAYSRAVHAPLMTEFVVTGQAKDEWLLSKGLRLIPRARI